MDRGRFLVCLALAVPVVVLSATPSWQFEHWPWICLVLAAPVVARGTAALWHGPTGDDTPALLATTGALAWSAAGLLFGPAGDPGWTQPFGPQGAAVRLDVAVAVVPVLLALAHRRAAGGCGRSDRVVVPVVLAVAAGTLGYRLGAGDDVAPAVWAALAVLLVAAPGTLRRPSPGPPERIERRVGTVAFTSRALTGTCRLDDVHLAPDTARDDVLRLAGSVAEPSTHPVARAIAATAAAELPDVPAVGEFDEHPGLGACGLVAELHAPDGEPDLAALTGPSGRRADGMVVTVVAHAVLVGHPDLLAQHAIALPEPLAAARAQVEDAGHTAVAVAWDGRARAVLAVTADVAPDAAAAVRAARRIGTVPALLSARPGAAAEALARRAGIDPGADTVLSGAGAVAGLRERGQAVAVVGYTGRDDGSLAAADVALAVPVGTHGAAAAVSALRRRRRRPGPVRWPAVAAVAYHVAALTCAASGMIDPLVAGALGILVRVTADLPPNGYLRSIRAARDRRHEEAAPGRDHPVGDMPSPHGS